MQCQNAERVELAGARVRSGARVCQQDLAALLGLSVKTLGRRLAGNLVPAPDVVEAGRPFWFAHSVAPLIGAEAAVPNAPPVTTPAMPRPHRRVPGTPGFSLRPPPSPP